jgi:hypothetical protein
VLILFAFTSFALPRYPTFRPVSVSRRVSDDFYNTGLALESPCWNFFLSFGVLWVIDLLGVASKTESGVIKGSKFSTRLHYHMVNYMGLDW